MHVGCHNKAGYKFNIAYLYDTQNVSNTIYIKHSYHFIAVLPEYMAGKKF